MRVVAAAVAVIAGVPVVAGCAGSNSKVSLGSPPAQQVELARASNGLFSIFPAAPGTRKCAIPDGASATALHGICQSRVAGAKTQEPALIVTFTETWNSPPCAPTDCTGREARQHTWQVVEAASLPPQGAQLQVAATHSSGVRAPQSYK